MCLCVIAFQFQNISCKISIIQAYLPFVSITTKDLIMVVIFFVESFQDIQAILEIFFLVEV